MSLPLTLCSHASKQLNHYLYKAASLALFFLEIQIPAHHLQYFYSCKHFLVKIICFFFLLYFRFIAKLQSRSALMLDYIIMI